MFSIIYLEEKIVTRNSFVMSIEQQEECKVIYNSGSIPDFCQYIVQESRHPDLCIIADSYNYKEIVQVIQTLRTKTNHTYILLKSDAKFMKAICYLMKHGLNGIFFTDEPLIDLKKAVRTKTRFNLTADKSKLITSNIVGEIQLKALNYNCKPLTQNEIKFVQACTKDLSYEEIATILQKSVNTIYGYRDRVFKKLQVKQRTAMVMAALKKNYIDL
jgi:DNA-binding NarL/FixJ family response regulator